jgi:hypothetical protein
MQQQQQQGASDATGLSAETKGIIKRSQEPGAAQKPDGCNTRTEQSTAEQLAEPFIPSAEFSDYICQVLHIFSMYITW